MSSDQSRVTALGVAPKLWYVVALNLAALLIAVLATYLSRAPWPLWVPVVALVSSSATGAIFVFHKATRPFGIGCLSGTALSASVFLVLFLIFFVTYFVVPGGHELS